MPALATRERCSAVHGLSRFDDLYSAAQLAAQHLLVGTTGGREAVGPDAALREAPGPGPGEPRRGEHGFFEEHERQAFLDVLVQRELES